MLNIFEDKRFSPQIDQSALTQLKRERDKWPFRPHEKRWSNVLDKLNKFKKAEHKDYSKNFIEIGQESEVSVIEKKELTELAHDLIPWKKGPFKLFDIEIDGEWRSDYKWERICQRLPSLENRKILDIGCNNGYFMFRMLEHNPQFILGIDPVVRTWAQFQFLNYFADNQKLSYELFGVEHLIYFKKFFDTIFSMGILYHHRNPIQQLLDMREALCSGGKLVLETIVIDGDESYALFPEGRYAQMPNVWFLPTQSCLINWLKKTRYENIEVLHNIETSTHEQRRTSWCHEGAKSYEDFITKNEPHITIEGHPAPRRICIIAQKKKG